MFLNKHRPSPEFSEHVADSYREYIQIIQLDVHPGLFSPGFMNISLKYAKSELQPCLLQLDTGIHGVCSPTTLPGFVYKARRTKIRV